MVMKKGQGDFTFVSLIVPLKIQTVSAADSFKPGKFIIVRGF